MGNHAGMLASLEGLSLGDQFGQLFFAPGDTASWIERRSLPPGDWLFTDDTVMTLGVCEQLVGNGHIDQDGLAAAFVRNHDADPLRGYGATARRILREIAADGAWREVSAAVFDGMGSLGNGAAMRVGPLGAFFAADLDQVKHQADLSAAVTHAHADGRAGAVAVAVAAAVAGDWRGTGTEFIHAVYRHTPASQTRDRIHRTLQFSASTDARTVAAAVGNGERISAPDTVPFALWCAAHRLDDFADALWTAVSVLGDSDTVGAIVGGIVALHAPQTIPPDWKNRSEDPLRSVFWNH
jgi:ADP-ribosylglycohydrolase